MSASTASPPVEQRKHRRRTPLAGTAVSCRLGTLGLGADIGVRLHDLCEEGIRLVVTTRLAPGDEIEVSLTPLVMSRPVVRVATVVWCGAKSPEGFWAGATFQSYLSYFELMHLTG